MSNLSQFTNKQNMNLLWDVLLDELHINTNNKSVITNVKAVFEGNIKPFTSNSNPKSPIMELNKQFLSQVVLAVNRLFPNFTKQEQNIKRITITNEEVYEPYKIEDIHASRQSDFEKELERKRIDLDTYMTPQKPRELDFSDRGLDGKITAMDSLVAEKMAQRNLEIEQFQSGNHNTSGVDPEKWLKPSETSVKGEKIIPSKIQSQNQNRLKHINIDDNNNISLTIQENKNPKKVSWEDDNITEEPIMNIFQKLKKQTPIPSPSNQVEEQQQQQKYAEQKSLPLPEVKQEQINTSQVTPIIPIIPKNEMVKQLNEMNEKIDNLYEMVSKLTNLLQDVLINNDKKNDKNNSE